MIRVGEKVLQKLAQESRCYWVPLNMVGILLISFTFLSSQMYVVVCVIGYLLYGLGLGFYATPSTDTAISNSPEDKVGVASGIYKMASSLGGAFGIAFQVRYMVSGQRWLILTLRNVRIMVEHFNGNHFIYGYTYRCS